MSASDLSNRSAFAASPVFDESSVDDLAAGAAVQPWLWHGLLAPGVVTLMTSQWKSGKTTLMSVLLSRLQTGGEFAGRPLAAGKAVIVSEESKRLWSARHRLLGFGRNVSFILRPFAGRPAFDQWLALIDHLVARRQRQGLDLAIIDPLAAFLPGHSESNETKVMEGLLPLQELTNRDVAVVLLHHPNKGKVVAGQAARGSGALSAFADILVELTFCGRYDPADRRRLLRGFSRHEETPARWVIELNAQGTDYSVCSEPTADDFPARWDQLHTVLQHATSKMTCRQLIENWPEDFDRLSECTFKRLLKTAVDRGLVSRDGTGFKNDPYRYWLPEREKQWLANPDYRFQMWVEQERSKQMGGLPGGPFA